MCGLCSATCVFGPQLVENKLSGLFSQVLPSLASLSVDSALGWSWLTLLGSWAVVTLGQGILIFTVTDLLAPRKAKLPGEELQPLKERGEYSYFISEQLHVAGLQLDYCCCWIKLACAVKAGETREEAP